MSIFGPSKEQLVIAEASSGFRTYMLDKYDGKPIEDTSITPMVDMLVFAAACFTHYLIKSMPDCKKQYRNNPELISRRLLEVLIAFYYSVYRSSYAALKELGQCTDLIKIGASFSKKDLIRILPQKVLNADEIASLLHGGTSILLGGALSKAIYPDPQEYKNNQLVFLPWISRDDSARRFSVKILEIYNVAIEHSFQTEYNFNNQYPF